MEGVRERAREQVEKQVNWRVRLKLLCKDNQASIETLKTKRGQTY